MLPFALGNFAGPLILGRLFDTLGRRIMITATYALSGILMAGVGYLFVHGALTATQQTIAWTVIFFFASAAASSAYLTVGETFPLEVRAVAISVFYALGTAIGGIAGPPRLRRPHPDRRTGGSPLRLPPRRRPHGRRRRRRMDPGRRSRRPLARGRGPPALLRLTSGCTQPDTPSAVNPPTASRRKEDRHG